jgi:hypothetical protein
VEKLGEYMEELETASTRKSGEEYLNKKNAWKTKRGFLIHEGKKEKKYRRSSTHIAFM